MHPTLNIAVKAARRAASVINRASTQLDLLTVQSKSPNDFVTEVDRAAEQAVSRWRFVPAKRGDTPVEAWVLVPIVFKLTGN